MHNDKNTVIVWSRIVLPECNKCIEVAYVYSKPS